MSTRPTPEHQLLTANDLIEPLQPADAIDANAILYMAGEQSATPEQINAFAYFHRKRLRDLVAYPAIESDAMLGQLFEELPRKLEHEALLGRLTTEVERIQETMPAIELFPATAPATQHTTQIVSTQKAQTVHSKQLQLFTDQSAAFEVDPSQKLVKKAREFQDYNTRMDKVFGPSFKLRKKLGDTGWRHLLTPVNIIDFAISGSCILLLDNTVGKFKRRIFRKQLLKEYPHLDPGPNAYWRESVNRLRGGTVADYAKAVLNPSGNPEIQRQNSDDSDPPEKTFNQLSIKKPGNTHSHGKNLTFAVGEA